MDWTTIKTLALAAAAALTAADRERLDHSGLTPEQEETLGHLDAGAAAPHLPAVAVVVDAAPAGAFASGPTRS